MIRNLTSVLMICLFAFSLHAHAEAEGQSSVKMDDVQPQNKKNYMSGSEEIDDMITNANLRALSGSKSKWSLATQFNYNGGSVGSPLSEDRPNIADTSGTTVKSDLDGSLWLKYNIDVKNSLMLGFGVRWIAPLAKNGPSNYDGTTFDALNPEIQYQRLYKYFGIQAVLQASLMQWTQADQTAVGYAQQFNIDQENMYEFGESGLSIGASTWVQYQTFNKSGSYGSASDPDNYISDLATVQSQYAFFVAPVLEYEITDKLTFRTLVGLWQYEHYLSDRNPTGLIHDKIYQAIGFGISITRDIYLNPNVQFLPDDIRGDKTNVALNATINVF